jgi:hypothetical protein
VYSVLIIMFDTTRNKNHPLLTPTIVEYAFHSIVMIKKFKIWSSLHVFPNAIDYFTMFSQSEQ